MIDLVLPARDLRGRAAGLKVEPIAGCNRPISMPPSHLARDQVPGAEPGFAFLPARPDQPFRVGLLRAGQQKGAPAVTIFVDPWSRRVIEVFDPRQFSIGEKVLAWQHALHAGQALGWVWKLLVFLSGLLPLLFAVTGLAMWRLKRARAARRSPLPLSSSITSIRLGGPANERLRCTDLAGGGPALAASAAPVMAQDAPAVTRRVAARSVAWGMFLTADQVVKAVIVGLVIASVVTWTVGLAKAIELAASSENCGERSASSIAPAHRSKRKARWAPAAPQWNSFEQRSPKRLCRPTARLKG